MIWDIIIRYEHSRIRRWMQFGMVLHARDEESAIRRARMECHDLPALHLEIQALRRE